MRVTEAALRHGDVRALGEPQQRLRRRIVQAAQLVRPRAGRVHYDQRAHGVRAARERVAHGGPPGPPVRLGQTRGLGVIRDERARLRGAPHRRDHETRVVGLRVVVERRAAQRPLPQSRLEPQHGLASEPAVGPHVAERREQIVQPHAGDDLPAGNAGAAVHRKQERQWAHQVGGGPQQHVPLAARLEHEAEIELLEIAEAAVDEP